MEYSDLYVSHPDIKTLNTFVEGICKVLGIKEFSERESSNYKGETYFIAKKDKLNFHFALTDDEGYEDLQFWASIESDSEKGARFQKEIEVMINGFLLPAGFKVARHDEKDGGKRINYFTTHE